MMMEGDLTWGGEYTIQCIHDMLYNCAPESYIILLTSVSQKKKKKNQCKGKKRKNILTAQEMCNLTYKKKYIGE